MPRPKLVSDTEVLDATLGVMLQLGPDRFTLTDVANKVGLSRAALIQRFGDKAALQRQTMQRQTDEVYEYFAQAPQTTGLRALWAMLRDLIDGMGAGEGFSGYLLLAWGDVNDPHLNRLARERNALVRHSIVSRLPPGPEAETNAGLIHAVIQGASMLWMIDQQGGLAEFVEAETRKVIERLYPGQALD